MKGSWDHKTSAQCTHSTLILDKIQDNNSTPPQVLPHISSLCFDPVRVLRRSVAREPRTKWLTIRLQSCSPNALSFPPCNLPQWLAYSVLQWQMLQRDHCTGSMTRQTLRNCCRKIGHQSSGRRASHLSTLSQLGIGAATTMF